MMISDSVGLALAKKLANVGYSESTKHLHSEDFRFWDILKWLREKKNISVEIYTNASGYNWVICRANTRDTEGCGTLLDDSTNYEPNGFNHMNDGGAFNVYEYALSEAITQSLKFIK